MAPTLELVQPAAEPAPLVPWITEPGVYEMTAEQYHADPVVGGSLSSTGARALLPPGCPAKFRWTQDHGQEPKRAFDLGHAAHRLVLGDGPELVVIQADSYRSNAAKAAVKEAREAGKVPLLTEEHEQVQAMAAALRQHPLARALFDLEHGRVELALVWRDDRTGVMRRALLDYLPDQVTGRRVIVPDYKTCVSAEPEALRKVIQNYGLHMQGDWYLSGARALGLAGENAVFLLVFQEKTPPYVVTVAQPDHVAMRIAAAKNRRALDVFAHCQATGEWPPYVDDVAEVALPKWAEIEEGEHLT